jgi:hypothetical protein
MKEAAKAAAQKLSSPYSEGDVPSIVLQVLSGGEQVSLDVVEGLADVAGEPSTAEGKALIAFLKGFEDLFRPEAAHALKQWAGLPTSLENNASAIQDTFETGLEDGSSNGLDVVGLYIEALKDGAVTTEDRDAINTALIGSAPAGTLSEAGQNLWSALHYALKGEKEITIAMVRRLWDDYSKLPSLESAEGREALTALLENFGFVMTYRGEEELRKLLDSDTK